MDLEIVPEIPRSGENKLLPYEDVIEKLQDLDEGQAAVFRGFTKNEADKIVRTFKRWSDVEVHTRASEVADKRDIYVKLADK